jgi:threonyl-tRNA synthetase
MSNIDLHQSPVAYQSAEGLIDLSLAPENRDKSLEVYAHSAQGLDVLRHSCTHLMAQAIKELYPQAQLAIGPVIENGFYYDFDLDHQLSENDFEKIEKKMKEIAKRNLSVSRKELSRQEAIDLFRVRGEGYKIKIIEDLADETIFSSYQQGDFIDLCRGPHVPSTGYLKHFKLMKLSGAYWKADASQKMLQRLYGTCFSTHQELEDYLICLEEAQKRDHRLLGQRLELFHIQEEAPGMVFWHPKGWTLFRLVEEAIRKFLDTDYQEVRTPQVVNRSLWEKSGHWSMFSQNMFQTQIDEDFYAIKPMNCPCHVQIFKQKIHSYRDLPLRLAEFGSCHRYEPSGALHGLMRLRNFTQDDAHIFCTEEQILPEVSRFNALLKNVYQAFGFDKVAVKLSTRPENRVGTEEQWDKAEKALAEALSRDGMAFDVLEGEGAFYGPKIEFQLKDSLGRTWQLGTIQLDFSMPARLGAVYIDSQGQKQHPVMIHRAILGSIERFIAILLEHYAGSLPYQWSPVQVMILPISEKHRPYGEKIHNFLKSQGVRVETDLRNEKIGYKIRDHILKKVPFMILAGDKEEHSDTVSIRLRSGETVNDVHFDHIAQYLV